jgi:hypothetical protein
MFTEGASNATDPVGHDTVGPNNITVSDSRMLRLTPRNLKEKRREVDHCFYP